MDSVVTTGIISIVTAGCSSLFTWIFARKKYNSEVDGNYISNLEHAVDNYGKIIDSYKEEINRKKEEIEEMQERMNRMQTMLDEMQIKMNKLQDQLIERSAEMAGLVTMTCVDLGCSQRKVYNVNEKK